MIVATLMHRANAKFGLPFVVAALGWIFIASVELRWPSTPPKAFADIVQPMLPPGQTQAFQSSHFTLIPSADEAAEPIALADVGDVGDVVYP